jgi:hypothetical protein
MNFKTTATLTCVNCEGIKSFPVDADVFAETIKDSIEIRAWEPDAFELKQLDFKGLCPNCKYSKAA